MKNSSRLLLLIFAGLSFLVGALYRLAGEPALAVLLGAYAITVYVLYRGWAAIQDGYASESPRNAALFSFVPIFQLYWLFPLLRGFAVDYNALIARRKIDAPPLKVGLFTAAAVLWFFALVPIFDVIWRLAPAALAIVQLLALSRVFSAIARLPKIEPEPAAVETAAPATTESAPAAAVAAADAAPDAASPASPESK